MNKKEIVETFNAILQKAIFFNSEEDFDIWIKTNDFAISEVFYCEIKKQAGIKVSIHLDDVKQRLNKCLLCNSLTQVYDELEKIKDLRKTYISFMIKQPTSKMTNLSLRDKLKKEVKQLSFDAASNTLEEFKSIFRLIVLHIKKLEHETLDSERKSVSNDLARKSRNIDQAIKKGRRYTLVELLDDEIATNYSRNEYNDGEQHHLFGSIMNHYYDWDEDGEADLDFGYLEDLEDEEAYEYF